MTDDELIVLLRLSNEPLYQFTADRLAALAREVAEMKQRTCETCQYREGDTPPIDRTVWICLRYDREGEWCEAYGFTCGQWAPRPSVEPCR